MAAVDRQKTAHARAGDTEWLATVPGAGRHYAWIRACALHGLERRDEAEALLARLADAGKPNDDRFIVDPNARVFLRGWTCVRDARRLLALLTAQDRDPETPEASLWLQPAYRPSPAYRDLHAAFLVEVARSPASRARYRELAPELAPALRGWETP